MVLPQHARGAALVALALLLLPGALAGHDPMRPLEVHKPDLYPGSPRFTLADERFDQKVCLETYNHAPSAQTLAGFFDVKLNVERLLENQSTPWEEEYQRTTQPLQGGQFQTFCWALLLPAGEYLAFATVDAASEVDEADETNNVHYRAYYFEVEPEPRPNLRIATRSFLIGPGDGVNGRPQYFDVRVTNAGNAPSPGTTVEFRDETGVLGEVPLRPLEPGRSVDVFIETDPSVRAAGSYNALAILDPDDLVEESDEQDNAAARAYVILPHPTPDLAVHDIRVNGTLVERRALRLEVLVGNVGNRSAGTSTFRFDIDGVPVANQTLDRLTAGANATLVFPFYLTSGNHTVRVVADPDLVMGELDETNNAYQVTLSVEGIAPALRFPNLVIERLSALPDDPGPGEVVTVNAYVRNVGQVPSDNATLAVILDGRRIGEARIPPILPDRYHSALVEWTNASVGPHALRAYVDANAEVREIHEDDNNDTLFVTILAPRVEQPPPVEEPPAPPVDETPPDAAQPPAPAPDAPGGSEARAPRSVQITQVEVVTRPVPGGLKARINVGLRNPDLDPLGRVTVAFRVDGRVLREVLVEGIPSAGLTGTTSGEVDVPAGAHDVQVEARVVGSTAEPAVTTAAYDAQAGEKGVPGAPLGLVLAGLAGLALARRKAHG